MTKTKTIEVVKVTRYTRTIPQHEHVCPVCGTTFTGAKVAVYDRPECSNIARQRRFRDKHKEQRNG